MRIRPVNMEFLYGTAFLSQSPEAYERLILDAMRGEATLFTRNDEAEAQWRICDPIVSGWAETRTSAAAVSGRQRRARSRPTRCCSTATAGARSDAADHELAALDDTVWSAQDTTPAEIEAALRRPAGRAPRRERRLRAGARAEPDLHRRSPVERRDREPAAARRALPRVAHDRLRGQRRDARRSTRLRSVAADAAPTDGRARAHARDRDPRPRPRAPRAPRTRSSTRSSITDLTTLVWAPHGHWEAVEALRGPVAVRAARLDGGPRRRRRAAARAGAARAPLRRRPRLAALDAVARADRDAVRPAARSARGCARSLGCRIRNAPESGAAALLLCGWLRSRLGWPQGPAAPRRARPRDRRDGRRRRCELESVAQDVPGLDGRHAQFRDGGRDLARPRPRRAARDEPRRRRHRAPLDAARRLARRGRDPRRGASASRCCATRPTARRSTPRRRC